MRTSGPQQTHQQQIRYREKVTVYHEGPKASDQIRELGKGQGKKGQKALEPLDYRA